MLNICAIATTYCKKAKKVKKYMVFVYGCFPFICIDLIDMGFRALECRLMIAEVYYELADFRKSRIECERVLRNDPDNERAKELHDRVRAVVSRSKFS